MYHTIIILGNIGSDPEMRYIQSGQAVLKFSLASNKTHKKDGEAIKETCWFRVTVWGKQAETLVNFLAKGKPVLVEGSLSPDPATGNPKIWNKQDGTPASSYEVTAQTVRMLGGKNEDEEPVSF